MTKEELIYTFSVCGFLSGIRFTLENIDIREENAK